MIEIYRQSFFYDIYGILVLVINMLGVPILNALIIWTIMDAVAFLICFFIEKRKNEKEGN